MKEDGCKQGYCGVDDDKDISVDHSQQVATIGYSKVESTQKY